MYNRSVMVIVGTISKEQNGAATFWATVDALGCSGYGATRKEACARLAEAIKEDVEYYVPARSAFHVEVVDNGETGVSVSASDTARLIALVLREERGKIGMSLAEVAEESGAKSRNGYAQYEQGRIMPSLAKLTEMLDIVAPDLVLAIIPRNAKVLVPDRLIEPEFDQMIEGSSEESLWAWVKARRAHTATKRDLHKKRRAHARAAPRTAGARAANLTRSKKSRVSKIAVARKRAS